MSTRYIYTEKNDCQDCYKCIRECPVKAIKIENQSASVIQDYCIYCGHCTQVCPIEAKKIREDISTARYLLRGDQRVIVSLAPSWEAEFSGIEKEQLIAALKELGFSGVSQTALGAEIVSSWLRKHFSDLPAGAWLSSCCPASVELVRKYYPQHASKILSIDTPMLAHGKYLRQHYGKEIKVVFIGPCIAKKKEADMNPGIVDAVITFSRLKEWLEAEGIDPEQLQVDANNSFEPFPADKGNLYPIEGGMLSCLNGNDHAEPISGMAISGVDRIASAMESLDRIGAGRKIVLELMACDGGCINGPGCSNRDSLVFKKMEVETGNSLSQKLFAPDTFPELFNDYSYIEAIKEHTYPESDINETLRSIGKQNREDELNCGGCGYESCRDFARAVMDGKAERKMCVSYMRRLAQNKASALLQRMPYGVVIVDKNLHIVESNRNFAELAGENALLAYDAKPGLEGTDLRKLVSYHNYFENLLHAGENTLEKDVKTDAHFLHLSIFPLQAKHLLCGIVHNLRAPELRREEIVKRTRKVIRENLETVQKISFYLGENASNMETLLNSIVNIQDEDYEDE